jgi:hypothetical protein
VGGAFVAKVDPDVLPIIGTRLTNRGLEPGAETLGLHHTSRVPARANAGKRKRGRQRQRQPDEREQRSPYRTAMSTAH